MARIAAHTRVDGSIDGESLRSDLAAQLLTMHEGYVHGVSTRQIVQMYYGYSDTETMLYMQWQLQVVRNMLQERATPVILMNRNRLWYVVPANQPVEARAFMNDRAKRVVRAHGRLQTVSTIAQTTYQLAPADPLVRAIDATTSAVQRLSRAAETPMLEAPVVKKRSGKKKRRTP